VELERLAFELSAVEAQHGGKEPDRAISGLDVPNQTARRAFRQVAQVPRARRPNVRACDDLPVDDRLRPFRNRVGDGLASALCSVHYTLAPSGSKEKRAARRARVTTRLCVRRPVKSSRPFRPL
jgi:hypothetical protein